MKKNIILKERKKLKFENLLGLQCQHLKKIYKNIKKKLIWSKEKSFKIVKKISKNFWNAKSNTI